MGAWIEICNKGGESVGIAVAPLVGAWIEIMPCLRQYALSAVAPLVGAWIEISPSAVLLWSVLSLLSWERGLKSITGIIAPIKSASLLSWERGLKC